MSDRLLQPVQDNNIEKTLTIYQKYNYLINKKISLYSGYNNSSADDLKNEIALSIYKELALANEFLPKITVLTWVKRDKSRYDKSG